MADIKGINPIVFMHIAMLEESAYNNIESLRKLNPTEKKVVKYEIIRGLDVGIIYPISDSVWMSPVQFVSKKGDMALITNERN